MGAAMYAMSTLTLAVAAIPILFLAWKVMRVPLRSWLPILALIGIILLIQGIGALIGEEGMLALVYLLAGAGLW